MTAKLISLLPTGHRCNLCGAVLEDICDLEDHMDAHRMHYYVRSIDPWPPWKRIVRNAALGALAIGLMYLLWHII